MPAEVFVSHSRRKVSDAQKVMNAIVKGLQAGGCALGHAPGQSCILIDEHIGYGDEWRRRLYVWLNSCNSALLLCSEDDGAPFPNPEDALREREWLYYEAAVLMNRKFSGHLSTLVPVYAAIERKDHIFAAFSALNFQALQGCTFDFANEDPLFNKKIGKIVKELLAAGPADGQVANALTKPIADWLKLTRRFEIDGPILLRDLCLIDQGGETFFAGWPTVRIADALAARLVEGPRLCPAGWKEGNYEEIYYSVLEDRRRNTEKPEYFTSDNDATLRACWVPIKSCLQVGAALNRRIPPDRPDGVPDPQRILIFRFEISPNAADPNAADEIINLFPQPRILILDIFGRTAWCWNAMPAFRHTPSPSNLLTEMGDRTAYFHFESPRKYESDDDLKKEIEIHLNGRQYKNIRSPPVIFDEVGALIDKSGRATPLLDDLRRRYPKAYFIIVIEREDKPALCADPGVAEIVIDARQQAHAKLVHETLNSQ